MKTILFGFGHRARNGKDTVARFILEGRKNKYDIRICSFASELKKEVTTAALQCGGMRQLIGGNPSLFVDARGDYIELPDWVQYDSEAPMDDPDCPLGKQRALLQWWGTDYRRSIDSDYWVRKVDAHIKELGADVALIPDMRFPNEMKYCQDNGFAIKVIRPSAPVLLRPHPSEEDLARVQDHQWDAIIYNDGSLEDLKKQALFVFDDLMETGGLKP